MSSRANTHPFRVDDKPGEDTRHVVRSVLCFMAQSFEVLELHNECLISGSMLGASHIINACARALEEGGDDVD